MSEFCQNLCFELMMRSDVLAPELEEARWQTCLSTCEGNLTIALCAGGLLIALGVVIYIAVRLAIKHSAGTGA